MAGAQPEGEIAPLDGFLPPFSVSGAELREFGAYVHIPFCRVRCGYCDFNTYTSSELRGVSQSDFQQLLEKEIAFSEGVLENSGLPKRELSSVFFGGGTPTLLPAADLVATLHCLRDSFGITPDAEITVEANPDTVDADYFDALQLAGFTRVSFGVQSAVPHVLATLDRTHDPAGVADVVCAAKAAGLATSIDLIYGTPGESLADWRSSLEFAIAQGTDHISAYALIVEEGTALARHILSGRIPQPSDDLQADMYELAEQLLSEAGFHWYEVSNWSKNQQTRSVHNLSYWTGQDWWGYGPGSHSHIGGVRWWNIKHPAPYAERLHNGHSPAIGREILSQENLELERILLKSRIREGISLEGISPDEIHKLVADGLIDAESARLHHLVLTLSGRLLADQVVRRLTENSFSPE